jgi:hypothetical protein
MRLSGAAVRCIVTWCTAGNIAACKLRANKPTHKLTHPLTHSAVPVCAPQATLHAWRKDRGAPPQYRAYLQEGGVPGAWWKDAQDSRSRIEVVGEWSLVLHAAEGERQHEPSCLLRPILVHAPVAHLGDPRDHSATLQSP